MGLHCSCWCFCEMSYNLTEQQRKILASLSSGYTDRETYLRLGITEGEFPTAWTGIRDQFEGNIAETLEEMDLRHAFHRIERRRLEAELWASEARLVALMDTSPEAILVINGQTGRIERVNNQAVVLFGYTLKELIGHAMELLIPSDLKKVHVTYRQGFLNSVRKREMGYHPPIHAQRKDGSLVQLDIALTATAATEDVMVVCKVATNPEAVDDRSSEADDKLPVAGS